MSDAAITKSGTWIAHTLHCGRNDCTVCPMNLGIVDYRHPSRIRMAWWQSVGKRAAARRINTWNRHQKAQETR